MRIAVLALVMFVAACAPSLDPDPAIIGTGAGWQCSSYSGSVTRCSRDCVVSPPCAFQANAWCFTSTNHHDCANGGCGYNCFVDEATCAAQSADSRSSATTGWTVSNCGLFP